MPDSVLLEPSPPDLSGRHALVTGAGHGIGKAIARSLIASGSRVLAIDRSEEFLKRSYGGTECQTLVTELGPGTDAALLAERLAGGPDAFDLVVHNVGWSAERSFLKLSAADLDQAYDTMLRTPVLVTRRLVERLIAEDRPGSVLFVSSLHDTFVRGFIDYSTIKAAVAMLTRELAAELAPYRIRVNAVSPGWIETAEDDEPRIGAQEAVRLIPAGRFGTPQDVARVAMLLLSDAWAGYVTGVNWAVDGGLSLHNWLSDV